MTSFIIFCKLSVSGLFVIHTVVALFGRRNVHSIVS